MSRWESWVTFTTLWWSWWAANVTATPTPMPAASVNRVRIMVISFWRFSLPGGDLRRPASPRQTTRRRPLLPRWRQLFSELVPGVPAEPWQESGVLLARCPLASGETDVADVDGDQQRVEDWPAVRPSEIGATPARQADAVRFDIVVHQLGRGKAARNLDVIVVASE